MNLPRLARLIPLVLLTIALLPAAVRGQALELSERGSFLINTLEAPNNNTAYKGVIVKLGPNDDAAMCFDTELMRVSACWVRGSVEGEAAKGWAGLIDPRNATTFTAFHGGPPTIGVYSAAKVEKGKPGPKKTSAADMLRVTTKVGPGWAVGENPSFEDPRTPTVQQPKVKLGPLPKDVAHWKGLYVNGDKVVFSYTVGGVQVYETPGLVGDGPNPTFTRTIWVDKSDKPMTLAACDVDGESLNRMLGGASDAPGRAGRLSLGYIVAGKKGDDAGRRTIVSVVNGPTGLDLPAVTNGRVVVKVPARTEPALFVVSVWSGSAADAERKTQDPLGMVNGGQELDPRTLITGGPARWATPIETAGKLGDANAPYAVDTLTAPEKNPWNALVRFSGVDFAADGKSATLCTIGGDVWTVSGIDPSLAKLTWRRVASGMFQLLGIKVVDGKTYVLGRDGITRLVDLNGDGEFDLYENFNNDTQVTTNYHEFNLDLQADAEGNFYFPKGSPWPPDVKSDHQGTMMKVSKDGSKLEVIATGLRAPNGTALSPEGMLTASDNQGHWQPSSKVNWIRPGKFYGMVPAAHAPDKKEPKTFEQPLFWLPMNKDNSSGGQAFVPPGDRWGPGLGGKMIHLSYGMSSAFLCPLQKVDDAMQGAAIPMGLKFDSSCMRARFNPADGQLYLCGLKGWQTNAGRDGALHRVRYTGKPITMPVDFKVYANGIEITSGVPLDKATAGDPGTWAVEQWNYKWTGNYGSPEFSPKDANKKGHDDVDVKKVRVSDDGRTVFLEIDGLGPVDQMKVSANLKDAGGKAMKWEVYNTIQKVGAAKP